MFIKVWTNNYIEAIDRRMEKQFFGKYVHIRENRGDITLFSIKKVDNSIKKLSEILMNVILETYVIAMLERKVYSSQNLKVDNIEFFKSLEKELLTTENYLREKNYIREKLKEDLSKNLEFYLDGFIVFRLKMMDSILDRIILDKLSLLDSDSKNEENIKEMSQKSSYKNNIVRVFFHNKDYTIFDGRGKRIDREYFKEIASHTDLIDIGESEILKAILMTLYPEKIFLHIHQDTDKAMLKSLEERFENRVYICYDTGYTVGIVGNYFK